uniref:Ubiquitin-like protease family profile domain-containing protein n=1 Tax=Oryza glumipatula TaxID=40148 RepID=A0A0E0B2D9_9ORYZ
MAVTDAHPTMCRKRKICKIQVLDSMCMTFNRVDLANTLQGLQYHLNIIGRQQDLPSHKWGDLNVIKWPIIEQLKERIQEDSSSCGLFMLKIMENWTGESLSRSITQEDITLFRFKLASVSLGWKTNKVVMTIGEQSEDTKDSDDDVVILGSHQRKFGSTRDINETKEVNKKYSSLLSVVSKMSKQELISGLLHYIQQINCAEAMDSRPHFISLSLKQLQTILKKDEPLESDCFNMAICKFMYEKIQMIHKTKEAISNHCLDLQFWSATGFGKDPVHHDNVNLAKTVGSWSEIHYKLSQCKAILIPVRHARSFIVLVVDQESQTLYVLDPNPLMPEYKNNPNMRYTRKLITICDHFNKAMRKACPGSRWNEDINLWRQVFVNNPVYNRSLLGFLVHLFMCTWNNKEPHLPAINDGDKLRKLFLLNLLMYQQNECESNIPNGAQDFLKGSPRRKARARCRRCFPPGCGSDDLLSTGWVPLAAGPSERRNWGPDPSAWPPPVRDPDCIVAISAFSFYLLGSTFMMVFFPPVRRYTRKLLLAI